MTSGTDTFNPQELCSRKLWDMVNTDSREQENKAQLEAAVEELAERRSYLAELEHLGKLHSDS
jgi:hypothetical protein